MVTFAGGGPKLLDISAWQPDRGQNVARRYRLVTAQLLVW